MRQGRVWRTTAAGGGLSVTRAWAGWGRTPASPGQVRQRRDLRAPAGSGSAATPQPRTGGPAPKPRASAGPRQRRDPRPALARV